MKQNKQILRIYYATSRWMMSYKKIERAKKRLRENAKKLYPQAKRNAQESFMVQWHQQQMLNDEERVVIECKKFLTTRSMANEKTT